jgi:uncharacterized protein
VKCDTWKVTKIILSRITLHYKKNTMKTILKIVKKLFLGIGILVGLFVLYLFVIAIIPGFSAPKQTMERPAHPIPQPDMGASKKEVSFDVEGTLVSAWLYLPDNAPAPVPAIVLAVGGAGTKDMVSMERYARRFQQAGYAALIFDYRYWGTSGGEPRQLILIPDQLEDYAAAITYVRSLKEVDPIRVSLWGTSFGGGHAITIAAQDPQIACVVAQVPFMDGLESSQAPHQGSDGAMLLTIIHAQRDLVRSWMGLSPNTIPIVGRPGTVAMLTDPEAYAFFAENAPLNYPNETPARIMIRVDKYRPILKVKDVHSPVLFLLAENDTTDPIETVEEAASLLGERAQIKRYPITHYEIYTEENFEKSINDELEFLEKCIGSVAAGVQP